ncbi:hypothetical protein AAW12_23775 [Sphingobacterium sp. Ag1]|uniref:hypothetical protein n=1 Tax=Sphingobacterium sp. Ag1 TaxID=1643451 RepID=UPI00062783AA|nr:hypothetical protein [Sphingobacterium sp. Ag1]KKO89153.1 hypothetical protein AAW12_23775 [Sphingobacterium sp. Ag1]
MNLVGFIKEYNDIKEAVRLNELARKEVKPYSDVGKIIKYLDNGILLLAWMGYFVDVETKGLIAPDSYYTDGTWIWPSYFPYYLGRYPSMKIDRNFLIHIEKKEFNPELDETSEVKKANLKRSFQKN